MRKSILRAVAALTLVALLAVLVIAQGNWVRKEDAPVSGGYGEAVVGTCLHIYLLKQLNVNTTPEFWRYNCQSDTWQSASTEGLPLVEGDMPVRNGTALAFDHGVYIYALLGGRYGDPDRRLFYRYNILSGKWEPLQETPHAQGAGDAITWSGYDNKIYAFIGSNGHGGSIFARYDPELDEWQTLEMPKGWRCTDDGASLVWTGGEYLYALQGSDCDDKPSKKFAQFHIPTGSWTEKHEIPQGVDDGGSLIWIGNYVPEQADYIYALSGALNEGPGKGFYRYIISKKQWEQLADLPCPVGYYTGNRLAHACGHIYYWQGSPTTDRWECEDGNGGRTGKGFYMFEFPIGPSPGGEEALGGQIADHVVINEVELNPPGKDAGNEWVELYNPTANNINLTSWTLSTTHGRTVTLRIPQELSCEPVNHSPDHRPVIYSHDYLVCRYDKQWLDNEDESIVLRDAEGSEIDRTPLLDDTYNGGDGRTWQRCPNGQDTDSKDDWQFLPATKGESNNC